MQTIKYRFADGTTSEIEVTDEFYTLYAEFVQQEKRNHWKETRSHDSPVLAKSSKIFSSMASSSSTLRRSSCPASVSVTLRLLRTKSGVPISSSSSAICRDSVGCVIYSVSAALVMFSSRATVRKYFSTLSYVKTTPQNSVCIHYTFFGVDWQYILQYLRRRAVRLQFGSIARLKEY